MKKILVILECINNNRSSEGIASVNFLNSIDLTKYEVHALYYQYPQFEIDQVEWLNQGIILTKIPNDRIDFALSKRVKLKNFFSKYLGIVPLKKHRVRKFKKKISQLLARDSFDLIFTRTIATSACSHKAVLDLKGTFNIPVVSYFNDPTPFCLMPYPYSNGITYNPKFDQKEKEIIKNVINNSTAIASPSFKLNEFFLEFYKDFEKKTFVFPHVFALNQYELSSDVSKWMDPNKINITHCGSLLSERDPTGLLKAFDQFLRENPTFQEMISINFFGPISPNILEILKGFNHLDCIKVVNGRFSHVDSLSLMEKSDLIVLLESSYEESPFMPVKLAEIIGLEKLFLSLSPKNSETRRIIGSKYSLQTESNNVEEIKNILTLFFLNRLDLDSLQDIIHDLTPYVLPNRVNQELKNIFNFIKESVVLPK